MSVDASTQKKFLKKISEMSNRNDPFDIYDFGKQLDLNASQTDLVIEDLREKRLVEDDHSKDMIQDDIPRLKIKLTEDGKKEINKI